jgi:transcriptional regulator with XRE-family HTH domain
MANLLVVTANTIGNYESDRTRLPAGKLRKWAEVTGVPAEWIETGTDPGPDPATPVSPCNHRLTREARSLQLAA